MKQIYLKRGKEDSLGRFHPWIFSGAIHHVEGKLDDGDTVRVFTSEGNYIATGHFQHGSIAVRVLSFDDDAIDDAFFRRRIATALEARKAAGLLPIDRDVNTCFRLIHGEGDNLPGLILDIYGGTAVMQAHSIGMHHARQVIAQALREAMLQGAGHTLETIYYKSETTLPFFDTTDGFLYGKETDTIAVENGLKFHIDYLKGQKTGFFIDQRDNRALVGRYAHGRRVLNMFCYTGGFSVYAMRGGAQCVHSVDSSERAIAVTRDNIALNFPDDKRHEAFCEDAFAFLGNIRKEEAYDLVILDPPAFAKHRGALPNALKGYTRLNQKAIERMPAGSILFTFSCSQVVTKDQFRTAVFSAAAFARRRVRILHQLHQPADHPINIYHPEGEYLKGLVLYIE